MRKKGKEEPRIIRKKDKYLWTRPLTEIERADLLTEAQEQKAAVRHFLNVSEGHKGQAKEAKDEADRAQRRAFMALDNLEENKVTQVIADCDLILDYDAGEATYVHPETGEVLFVRPFTDDERQMTFDFNGENESEPPPEILEFVGGEGQ